MKFGVTFVAALLFVVSTTHAHEAIFSWTYTTDLTPKGHGEFEQWITTGWEKEHGSYSAVDFREEFEYGVTDNFQMAIYLNHHYVHANDDVPAADPVHPGNRLPGSYETGGEDVHAGHNPATAFDSYHFESVSLEGIYRLLSPYKDPLSLALYFEPSVGDQETELELKILLQKNWLEDPACLGVEHQLRTRIRKSGRRLRARRHVRMVHRTVLPLRAQLVSRFGILESS
jgi:hypothetical protein